jgi:hypothetical protein
MNSFYIYPWKVKAAHGILSLLVLYQILIEREILYHPVHLRQKNEKICSSVELL